MIGITIFNIAVNMTILIINGVKTIILEIKRLVARCRPLRAKKY